MILRVGYQPQGQDNLKHIVEKEEERGACGKKCVLIIEKVEEEKESGKRRARGNEIVVKIVLIVHLLLCSIVVTWSPRGEDHLSQRKKAGLVEAKERSRESWGWNCFEKVGVQHVDRVGDDGVVVIGGGDVGDSHNLPYNLPDRWNITSAPEKLPSTAFVLLMTRISLFSSSICKLDFSYFSSISSGAFSSFVLLFLVN